MKLTKRNVLTFEWDAAESFGGDQYLTPVYFNKQVLIRYLYDSRFYCDFASETYGTVGNDDFRIPFGINRNGTVIAWLGDRASPWSRRSCASWSLGRDLLFGSKNSQIATLVERQSRYVMLAKVGKKDTETVVNALIKHAQKLPHELYRSLTWDRGKEMADHRRFTLATDIKVYFCDPRSPWQRGSNENANGLLRQYLPKGIDLSGYSQAKLNAIARRLNERPRKTLHYETPAQRFHEAVASTS
jgi:Integrase core domain